MQGLNIETEELFEEYVQLIRLNKLNEFVKKSNADAQVLNLRDEDEIPLVYYAAYLLRDDMANHLLDLGAEMGVHLASLVGNLEYLQFHLKPLHVNEKYLVVLD